MSDEIRCPKCGSQQLTANKKGFSGKKAVAGAILTGGVGILAGTLGSNKIKITCLNCGNEFKPGQGAKSLLEIQKKKAGGCFVATACYGNYDAPEVLILRQFRDDKLIKSLSGKAFIRFYYSVSPVFATIISNSETLRKSVRYFILDPIIKRIQQKSNH